ncbi:pilus assembly protein [Sphingomonas sp. KRR8]|uniref:TadE/TadG family type IV pilus assembly protein n=1 Tax=Sphingomonas sp. KRR8 TaxID=2942996 RepID=UPI0020209C42|nr:TadE/TadG family type IV pilus assembly protein [Sphingomonas sp. KRR8]URD60879.1 pilus assembly protein [Sphingomonas sp. KRR8]
MSDRSLLSDERASGAAEFALVLIPLLMMLFGIIDGGRWLWECNQAEKATQFGARVAVVTDVIPSGLKATFVGKTVGSVTLTQGDVIPAAALGTVTCSKPSGTLSCSCAACSGLTLTPLVTTGWDKIVARMQLIDPRISESNVVVEYRGSGLGYAGDPSGMDISPLVTVRVSQLTFQPITTFVFPSLSLSLPDFATTLTAEDLSGTADQKD